MKPSRWDLFFIILLACASAGGAATAYDNGQHPLAAINAALTVMLIIRFAITSWRMP